MKHSPAFLVLSVFLCIILISCSEREVPEQVIDLPEIRERGELVAITSYSPISYFIYRGQVMGYEYELLQLYGEYLDLPVRIILARNLEEMMEKLETGEGDLIAYGLTVTRDRRQRFAFTDALNTTRQVLVQRKPEGWRHMMLHNIERDLIRSPLELAGKTIHVRRGSAYINRLQNLSDEIGAEIHIVEAEDALTTDELISMVAEGVIEFTIADENIALVQAAYYRDIDVATAVSLPQQIAWALRHASPLLLESLNEWLSEFRRQADFNFIYNKYFEHRHTFRSRYASDYFPLLSGRLSPYDDIFQAHAGRIGWDWRLLAALSFQESRFEPYARSWAGAAGLMQLMPQTAREFGAEDPYNPLQNISAGVNFLSWLDNYWKQYIDDDEERQHFVIASYNVGQGHVQDARRLAELHNTDTTKWFYHVEEFMLKKSNPEYYNHDVVRYGYASGIEPVTYVRNVYTIYNHYKLFVD
ncbi:MAG: transporter substrate-binding domain-containing protein [Bacteroidales bacterium]|nr:transporter substrate-binding domain-containing protein [Bacteroidales bacterium]